MDDQACIQQHRFDRSNGQGQTPWSSRFEELRAGLEALQAEITQSPTTLVPPKDIRAFIRARAQRQRFFGADLFADPAWDILLELYACELSQQRVSVSKLCFAVSVPTTTVLRWLALLERQGLIRRDDDPMDRRRVWVSLSSTGLDKMERYFDSLD